jgi:predicted nucleic acid-binding protein
MALRTDDPRRVVLDAGPLVGLFNERDAHRAESLRGFQRLDRVRATYVVPLPIAFEVFKWLLQRVGVSEARGGLAMMLARVELIYPTPEILAECLTLMRALSGWPGSLEDTVVAQTALNHDLPVWTFNYRDLRAFPNLQFWTPA